MRSTLLFACCLPLLTMAQQYEAAYDLNAVITSGSVTVAGCAVDANGDQLFAYSGGEDLFLLKTTPYGMPIWNRRFDLGENEGFYHHGVAVSGDRYAIAGFSIGNSTASRDAVLTIIDENGFTLASKRFDQAEGSNAFHAICAVPGGFAMAGRVQGASYDFHVTRTDLDGTVLWNKTFSSPGWDWLRTIAPAGDGVVVAGNSQDGFSGQGWDGVVIRLDAGGEPLWSLVLDTQASDDLMGAVHDPASNSVFVCGLGGAGMNGVVVRIDDQTGLPLWSRSVANNLVVQSVVPTGDGGVLAFSQPWNIAGGVGDFDAMLTRFDADGTALWSRAYGSTSYEYVSAMVAAPGNELLTATQSGGFGVGSRNIFVTRTSLDGDSFCSDLAVEPEWTTIGPAVLTHTLTTLSDPFPSFNFPPVSSSPQVALVDLCCITPTFTDHTVEETPENSLEWVFSYTGGSEGTVIWDAGDGSGPVEGITATHIYGATGAYTVCVTVEGVCDTLTACTDIVVTHVGIGWNEGAGWAAFPNPTTGDLELKTPWSGPAEVRVQDAQGRLVRSFSVQNTDHVRTDALHGLSPGIYSLRIMQPRQARERKLSIMIR